MRILMIWFIWCFNIVNIKTTPTFKYSRRSLKISYSSQAESVHVISNLSAGETSLSHKLIKLNFIGLALKAFDSFPFELTDEVLNLFLKILSINNRFCLFSVISSVSPHMQETRSLLQDSLKFLSITLNNITPKTASGHSVISLEVILLLLLNSAISISLSSWKKSPLFKLNKTLKSPKIVSGFSLNSLVIWE